MTTYSTIDDMLYEQVTHDIRITAQPRFLPDHSEPDNHHYLWAYRITIQNQSTHNVQLLRRYWHITDGLGNSHEIEGDGVIGEQPVIQVNNEYSYISSCPLTTDHGMMRGFYTMQYDDGDIVQITIPSFILHMPDSNHHLH